MDSLHQEATKMNPDIMVFPETALPSYLTRDNKTRRMLQETVDNVKYSSINWDYRCSIRK